MELLISEYPSLSLGCFNQINLNLITTETLKIVRHEIVSYGLPYDFTHIDTKRLFIHNFIMNVCNTKKLNVHDRFTYIFNHTEFLPEIVDIVEEIIAVMHLNSKMKPKTFYTRFIAFVKKYQLTSLQKIYFKQALHKLAVMK